MNTIIFFVRPVSKQLLTKNSFFLKKVKFHGHVIFPKGTQPIAKPVKSPESKRDIMKVLGCPGFYSCYIKNLHVDSQPFYDLIKIRPFFTGHKNTRNFFNELRKGSAKTRSVLCPLPTIPSHSRGFIKRWNWLCFYSTVP